MEGVVGSETGTARSSWLEVRAEAGANAAAGPSSVPG